MRKISHYIIWVIFLWSCNDDPIREISIFSFTPTSDGPGIEVQIAGAGFGNDSTRVRIDFNGTPASILSMNDTLLITEVPLNATSGTINIRVEEQVASSANPFEVLSGTWTKKQDLPVDTGFGAAVGFTIADVGYVGTGADNGRIFDTFWKYNPEIDQWSELPAIPGGGRRFSSGFVIGEKAYVGLGRKDNETEISSTFYQYDPLSENWNQIKDFPGLLPDFTDTYATFVIDEIGFLLLEKQLWRYESEHDSWSEHGVFPGNGISSRQAEVVNENVYIGLGFNYNSDWWKYDPVNNDWTSLSPYPGASTWGLSSFQIDQKIYVVGKQCWEYDPNTDHWTQKTSHPDGRRFGIGFAIKGNGYLGTGTSLSQSSQLFQKDFWEFSP